MSIKMIELPNIFSELKNGNLIVLASRPAVGKTTLLLNVVANMVLRKKLSVAIFSLEMSKSEIINRVKGLINEKTIIDDSSTSAEEIRHKCIELKKNSNIGLVVIDYFQLISTEKNIESREQELSYISCQLKSLARELDVPIIIAAQLSKDLESREDKRPILSDLKYVGSLKENADVILFMYRDDYYNNDSDNNGVTEIIVAKKLGDVRNY